MNIAGGIDLGGTKIEAQLFNESWHLTDKRRLLTPANYDDLLSAVCEQVNWLKRNSPNLPIGIAAAGLVNKLDGTSMAANLPSNGNNFVTDIEKLIDQKIMFLNDCRAFCLAEAALDVGSNTGTIIGLLIGTGIGGAIIVNGQLMNNGHGLSGEFGHLPLPAKLITDHNLPILKCGCGRMGCFETLGSGRGMERLAEHISGQKINAFDIDQARHSNNEAAKIWDLWCKINAELISILMSTVDPKTIILGGGLSQIPDLIPEIRTHLKALVWPGFQMPNLRLGTRGETAAALGAGLAAWKGQSNG